jgi:hypothetical protein
MAKLRPMGMHEGNPWCARVREHHLGDVEIIKSDFASCTKEA